MAGDDETTSASELLARLRALREENERLRAELARLRSREHETPPHYL